jgi:hypothetical protein
MTMNSGTFNSALDALVAVLQNIFDNGSQPDKEEALQICASFIGASIGAVGFRAICLPKTVGN